MRRSFDTARAEAVLKALGDEIEDLWEGMAALHLCFSQKKAGHQVRNRSFYDMA